MSQDEKKKLGSFSWQNSYLVSQRVRGGSHGSHHQDPKFHFQKKAPSEYVRPWWRVTATQKWNLSRPKGSVTLGISKTAKDFVAIDLTRILRRFTISIKSSRCVMFRCWCTLLIINMIFKAFKGALSIIGPNCSFRSTLPKLGRE